MLIEQLEAAVERYQELNRLVADPEIIDDQPTWQKYIKEHAKLGELVEVFKRYQQARNDAAEARSMLEGDLDSESQEWVRAELEENEAKAEELEEELKRLLIPDDPRDDKNVIMEIRAGAGGDEAALFAADLFRMYSRYAERQGWKIEIMSSSYNDLGGVKELTLSVEGDSAFSRLKFESGVHRVQRVPETESGGRIHTSTATVAVLPEVDEVEVDINPSDLEIDTYHSSGPGGQHVNKTESAIRITHLPTGLTVSCQDEKSQHKNRARAMKVLRARLYEMKVNEQQQEIAEERRSQVGTGDRSERIRTYNFPQNRVSDHRINLTLHRLDSVLDGDLDEIIEALVTDAEAARLQAAVE